MLLILVRRDSWQMLKACFSSIMKNYLSLKKCLAFNYNVLCKPAPAVFCFALPIASCARYHYSTIVDGDKV